MCAFQFSFARRPAAPPSGRVLSTKARAKKRTAQQQRSTAAMTASRKAKIHWRNLKKRMAARGVTYTPSDQKGPPAAHRGRQSLKAQYTLDRILELNRYEAYALLQEKGFIPVRGHCSNCSTPLSGKLAWRSGERHPHYQCKNRTCRCCNRTTANTWADHQVPLRKLGAIAWLASGQLGEHIAPTSSMAAQLVGVANRTCHEVLSSLRDEMAKCARREQGAIRFSGDCEVDATTLRTSRTGNGWLRHIRYLGICRRGDRMSTVVYPLPVYSTRGGGPTRPESHKEVDGILRRHLRGGGGGGGGGKESYIPV